MHRISTGCRISRPYNNVDTARALPQVAVDFRWPFARDSGAWGTQLIEPIAQVIVAPQTGDSQLHRYPNEDSLDFEFTDANLFGFNRFTGIDRLDGGERANVALHGAWYLGGTTFDGLVGQSYRTNKDDLFPVASGLHDQVSDIVARGTFAPTKWLDVTYRTRLDHGDAGDALRRCRRHRWAWTSSACPAAISTPTSIHTPITTSRRRPPAGNAYYFPRNEVTLGRVIQMGRLPVHAPVPRATWRPTRWSRPAADAIYEDECFIFDLRFYRRYTSIDGDGGSTAVLFLLTFKTIGQFGYRAL